MFYRNLFKIFVKEENKLLGRWKKINNQQILDYKIYLANSDSCYHSLQYNKNINDSIKDEKNI